MSQALQTHVKAVKKASSDKFQEKRLQLEPSRLFAGECSACRRRKGVVQRASHGPASDREPTIASLDPPIQNFTDFSFDNHVPAYSKSLSSVQAKLTVNPPGDVYELEADRIADRVMATPAHMSISSVPIHIQRWTGQAFERPIVAPTSIEHILAAPGEHLDEQTRMWMEPRFGRNFSQVRLHSDDCAAQSARSVNALAYTVGRHIVMGTSQHRPDTDEGRHLLAHELTHVIQQEDQKSESNALEKAEIGTFDSTEKRAKDSMKMHHPSLSAGIKQRTRLQRQVAGSVGWKGASGPNLARSTIKGIERIPLDNLAVGHQSGAGSSGKAIVLMSPALDPAKSVDVLLHFHGHNRGYEESGGKVRDDSIDNIESQLSSSSRPQLMAILPQGTPSSEFGETSLGGKKKTKSFDPDTYINNIFDVLINQGIWKSKPSLAGVIISGHSGAGELINEKILGSALGTSTGKGATPTAGSSVPAAFKGLALFDAINGPAEHARLYEFLQMKMKDELVKVQQKATENEKIAFLRSSFKFRAYYSHAPKIGNYYSQWHVGPVVNKKAVYPDSLQGMITKFLNANAAALGGVGSSVYKAFEDNYRIIDAGAADHDKMVSTHDNMKDAISVMPKREDGSLRNQKTSIPRMVYDTLQMTGKQLDDESLNWANLYFRRDMSKVRIYDDEQAAMSASAIQAKAYTAGRNIVFGRGYYLPKTRSGRRLLAHELTHVIQQEPRNASIAPQEFGTLHGELEEQADRIAATAADVLPAKAPEITSPISTPGIQLTPDEVPETVNAAMCEANANPHPAALGTCNYKEPENCPTYEKWINSFVLLKTFRAADTPGTQESGFKVIGGDPASKDFRPATPEPGPSPPPKSFAPLKPGERFIDHPTDTWVKTCLPENLRATAYQLPSDCADIAMILRHVWLAAHHRTQTFGQWTLGDKAGKASEKRVLDVISGAGTEQVANLVAPYSNAKGEPMRSIEDLAPLLHAGDILVWWHYDKGFDKPRTGGHTQTVAAVKRDDTGKLVDLTLIQGNEPLFEEQKEDIREFLKKEKPRRALPNKETLGKAPGRRIEEAKASTIGLRFENSNPQVDKSPAPIWKWGNNTLLIVAGPPKSAPRPASILQRGQKGPAVRRLTDWTSPLRHAAADDIVPRFESMLFEARATIEADSSLVEAEARAVGSAAGARIWELGKMSHDLANVSHFKPMQDIMDILLAFQTSRETTGNTANKQYNDITLRLSTQLSWIKEAFETAARGTSDISFTRGSSTKDDTINVLLTGFDPFEPSGSLRRPSAGEWNPSGAAALALDGERLPVSSTKGAKGIAAVESIVLPVSYQAFKEGIVEQAIGPHAKEVDAVLTVSEDSNLDPSKPVRLERYAVGVHHIAGNLEGVPPAMGGSVGPAIIESPAPLNYIASATEAPAKKGIEAIQKPTIGEGVVLQFHSVSDANAALAALGLPASQSVQTAISDEKALQQIISTMTRIDSSQKIKFQAGGKSFTAKVVEGPGGNFLSNEVSFRTLRLLSSSSSARDPISFHTHTQRSDVIPEDAGSAESKKIRKDALKSAMGLRANIIATLKRIISAVARLVLDKRSSSKP